MTITLDDLRRRCADIDAAVLDRWIENGWVRPDVLSGAVLFQEIDVARVRLIAELHYDLAVGEEAVPLVLSLLDQLYGSRRQVRLMREVLAAQPDAVRRAILAEMIGRHAGAEAGARMENPES